MRNPFLSQDEKRFILKWIALLALPVLILGVTAGILNNHQEFGTPIPEIIPLPTFPNSPIPKATIPCARPVVFLVKDTDQTTENSSTTADPTSTSETPTTTNPSTTTTKSETQSTPTSTKTTQQAKPPPSSTTTTTDKPRDTTQTQSNQISQPQSIQQPQTTPRLPPPIPRQIPKPIRGAVPSTSTSIKQLPIKPPSIRTRVEAIQPPLTTSSSDSAEKQAKSPTNGRSTTATVSPSKTCIPLLPTN